MIRENLAKRVNLEKLTKDDFRLRGEFRVLDGSYQGWRIIPEFRPEGTDAYVPIDQLFPQDRFHQCYELIVQTPDSAQVVGCGYLHQTQRGDTSFGTRSGIQGQEQVYINSSPIWFDLLDDARKPIVEGPVDLLLIKVSPWHTKRDAQRKRVLYD